MPVFFAGMAAHLDKVRALMEEKRREPGDDLLTDLIRAESEAERIQSDEIVALILSLIAAGGATTAQPFGLGLIELLKHPTQLARFRDDATCRPDACHEIARYQMPGRFSARHARHATRIGDRELIRGGWSSARWRPPSAIPRWSRIRTVSTSCRKPADTSVFGIARHFCIGAQLARLELAIGFGLVLERLRDLRLAIPLEDVRYGGNPAVQGPLTVPPLRFEPAASREAVPRARQTPGFQGGASR